MHLKKPLWSAGLNDSSREADPQAQASATAVEELVNSLNKQRLYREVTLALRTSLRDASAEFSFLRVRGLRSLLNFLRSVVQSDSTINLFCQTQSIPELQGLLPAKSIQFNFTYSIERKKDIPLWLGIFERLWSVVPVLFRHSLKDSEDDKVESLNHIFGVEPLNITGPSTGAEVALALRVLEGCCLLHSESTVLAHKYKAIEVLCIDVNFISCLFALFRCFRNL